MIQVFMISTCTLIATVATYVLATVGYTKPAAVFGTLFAIVLVIWACVFISLICEKVENQADDIHKYKKIEAIRDAEVEESKKDKKSYEEALVKYRDEVQRSLIDSYREFEETLMDKVKDSKLVAMMLEKSGYADVLGKHHEHIIKLSEEIRKCDSRIHSIAGKCEVEKIECIKRMLNRQNKGIYGFRYFFPEHLILENPKE